MVGLIGPDCVFVPFTGENTFSANFVKTASYSANAREKIDEAELVTGFLERFWKKIFQMFIFAVTKLGFSPAFDPAIDPFAIPRVIFQIIEDFGKIGLIVDLQ
jgi:hypothetical protein